MEFSFLYSFLFIVIPLEVGDITDISVSCQGNICDITDTTPSWTEGLDFNKELCEDKSISDQYSPGTNYI